MVVHHLLHLSVGLYCKLLGWFCFILSSTVIWTKIGRERERELCWQCCCLTVCSVHTQHTRRCGSTVSPHVSCSGRWIANSRGQHTAYEWQQSPVNGRWPITTSRNKYCAQLWNKANFMEACKTLQNKNWRNEQQNERIKILKYAVKQCFLKPLNAYFSSKAIHIYSALYMYSFIRSGLFWSCNNFIGKFYK